MNVKPSGRTVVCLALVFLSGMLLGGIAMNIAEHQWLHHHRAEEYDIRQHRKIAQKMGERLHLTDTQKAQVDQILQDAVRQYQQLQDEVQPQFDQIRQDGRDRLRALLNPDQRSEFDRIVQQVDAEYPRNERPATLPVPKQSETRGPSQTQ